MTLDTARTTGLFYLGLAVTGALGHLTLGPRVLDPADPAGTLARLVEQEPTARAALALELGVVLTQALAALWFYRLFRPVDSFAAGTLATFGMVNAVAILGSAAALATALDAASDPVGPATGAPLMYLVSDNLWGVGSLFFGLWLAPMGWLVLRSRWMPRALGWVLVVGGVCYVAGTFVGALAPGAEDWFAWPATVGELWMIGHLLVRGASRDTPLATSPASVPATPARTPTPA